MAIRPDDLTPTIPPHDPNPKKPSITLPPLACDSHFHVFGPHSKFPYAPNRPFTPTDASKEDLFRLRDAIDQYYADKGQYPASLDALVGDGYMRRVPEDPFTKSNSSWQTVPGSELATSANGQRPSTNSTRRPRSIRVGRKPRRAISASRRSSLSPVPATSAARRCPSWRPT